MNNKPQSDLTGKRFGQFTVIEYVGKGKWRCQCECGRMIETRTSRLKSSKHRTCLCDAGGNTSQILKPYVFKSLALYGNTVISERTFEYYGEEIVLEALRQRGFDCTIRIANDSGAKNIIIEMIR